ATSSGQAFAKRIRRRYLSIQQRFENISLQLLCSFLCAPLLRSAEPCALRRACLQLHAMQRSHRRAKKFEIKYRIVFRKKIEAVCQRDKIVFRNLRIGRVSVLDVDRAFSESGVPKRVINPDDVQLREAITLA